MSASADRTHQPFVLREAQVLLARSPASLDALLRGLPEPWTNAHEGGSTWSAFDVIGHLCHGERTDWMPRVRHLMAYGDSLAFERFDRFSQFAAPGPETLASRLDDFAALRAASLRELAALALTDADLDRAGLHPDLGPVTLRQLIATWVTHDLDHLMQVARVLGRQYGDEVGPWRAYLRVVSGVQG